MLAFVFLIAALLLFLLSTKQWRLWIRALIWVGGAAFIYAAIYVAVTLPGHQGFLRALQDVAAKLTHLHDTVLWRSFVRNQYAATRFVPALIDVLLACGALLGVFALVALTPGDALEKALRPIKIGLIGAIVGVLLSLFIVGIGFGGPVSPRAYAAVINNPDQDVYDGDTFWVGDTSVRIWGLDAPELHQRCSDEARCGKLARDYLARLLKDQLVRCSVNTKPTSRNPTGASVESFGRPLAHCDVVPAGQPSFDLAERMIQDGYATYYRFAEDEEPRDGDLADRAQRLRQAALRAAAMSDNLLSRCWLEPRTQRSRGERTARVAFDAGNFSEIDEGKLIGACT